MRPSFIIFNNINWIVCLFDCMYVRRFPERSLYVFGFSLNIGLHTYQRCTSNNKIHENAIIWDFKNLLVFALFLCKPCKLPSYWIRGRQVSTYNEHVNGKFAKVHSFSVLDSLRILKGGWNLSIVNPWSCVKPFQYKTTNVCVYFFR